ncbi:hypothetical protein J4439_04495 [Candidatus Woesearchaeota archaeon]|nr:hypothetical protein [Candidatus Woesearchaeota archaeon]
MAAIPSAQQNARVIRSIDDLLDPRSRELAERHGIRPEELVPLAGDGALTLSDYEQLNSPDNSERIREIYRHNMERPGAAFADVHRQDAKELAALLIARYELVTDPGARVPATGLLNRLRKSDVPLASVVTRWGLGQRTHLDRYLAALEREVATPVPERELGPGIFHAPEPYRCLANAEHVNGELDIKHAAGLTHKAVRCTDCGVWSSYTTTRMERERYQNALDSYRGTPEAASLMQLLQGEAVAPKRAESDLLVRDGRLTYDGTVIARALMTEELSRRR